jgi:ubiquinone/menaquinone biosynthesis C-methylase UbiE
MSPQPDPEMIKRSIAGVFDRGADTYDQVGVDFFTPAARDLVARAGLRPGERVLDLGTGRGAVLFAAAEAVGPTGRAVGIDLSQRMAELTQAEAGARGLGNVTAVQGDAERPDFPDRSFDALLAGLVLFFLPEPVAALNSYVELLAPGGRLAFTTFGRSDPHFDAAMKVAGSYVPGELPPRTERQGGFGSAEGIREVLTANGFAEVTVDEITYESRFADPDHWLAWVWSHGGRWTLERIPQDRLEEATTAAKAEFEGARTPAGDYLLHTEIRFTIARPAVRG